MVVPTRDRILHGPDQADTSTGARSVEREKECRTTDPTWSCAWRVSQSLWRSGAGTFNVLHRMNRVAGDSTFASPQISHVEILTLEVRYWEEWRFGRSVGMRVPRASHLLPGEDAVSRQRGCWCTRERALTGYQLCLQDCGRQTCVVRRPPRPWSFPWSSARRRRRTPSTAEPATAGVLEASARIVCVNCPGQLPGRSHSSPHCGLRQQSPWGLHLRPQMVIGSFDSKHCRCLSLSSREENPLPSGLTSEVSDFLKRKEGVWLLGR